MAGLATHVILWLWLGIFGFLLTRRALNTSNPWIVFGSAIPVALVTMLGVFFPLARLAGHPQGWVLGAIGLFVSTVILYSRREQSGATELEEFGFSPFQWACFMSLLTASNLVMHTREAVGPEDDYWIHFPLISLLNRGEFPPPNPFFNDLSLHGHFGRDYIVAILGWFGGGGEALLSSLWSFNHILSVSAFLLAFGLGKRRGGNAGGFLMSSFLFFGISVGSRVGLMDTYDNNNLLVYCLLLLFVALETTVAESKWSDGFLAFALGVYGIVYETHLLLFCMVLWLGPLLWRKAETGMKLKNWLRPLAISTLAIVIAACLGGPLQDLAMRAVGLRQIKVDHAATYQAQRVQMKFPKDHLFKIMVGPESYRRLSYVYQGKAFQGLQKTGKTADVNARADFHYAFVLGPDVLLMHWLALYLGLPVGLWLWRRKDCAEGQALWVFGLVSFLVPALVDFGPVHEREYFRWEFGAGFGFAGALAVALAVLWKQKSRWPKVLVVVLAILVTLGGERKVNRTLISMEKMPEGKRQRAVSPWYPSPRDWIVESPELRVDEPLLLASLELRKRSRPSDRMLVDLDARAHWEIFQESTVAGLAGLRSVGHVSPPPWMPDGIAPFFRTANWNAFWQTGDIRILPFMNSRWLLCHDPAKAELLEGKEGLKKIQEFERVSLWRYDGDLGSKSDPPSELAKVARIDLPTSRELRGEVALPMTLVLENAPSEPFDLGVQWVPLPGTDTGGPLEPVSVRCQPGQDTYSHHLVAPLVEGRYRLRFSINGTPISRVGEDAVLEFDWSREASQARFDSFQGNRLKLHPGSEFLAPPLKVGLRLYRLDEERYSKPFGFEAVGVWNGAEEVVLEPQEEGFDFQLPPGVRGDLFLIDRSGREVHLSEN
jgi:hypothetical protein